MGPNVHFGLRTRLRPGNSAGAASAAAVGRLRRASFGIRIVDVSTPPSAFQLSPCERLCQVGNFTAVSTILTTKADDHRKAKAREERAERSPGFVPARWDYAGQTAVGGRRRAARAVSPFSPLPSRPTQAAASCSATETGFARFSGDPNGNRTRVAGLKGLCPNRWTMGPRSNFGLRISDCGPAFATLLRVAASAAKAGRLGRASFGFQRSTLTPTW